ncbi:MAG: hypothetical protein RTU30_02445 [Candidatus Thorarchaeota archaeon]
MTQYIFLVHWLIWDKALQTHRGWLYLSIQIVPSIDCDIVGLSDSIPLTTLPTTPPTGGLPPFEMTSTVMITGLIIIVVIVISVVVLKRKYTEIRFRTYGSVILQN